MQLRVEFFGIPRARSGVASIELSFERCTATLREVLTRLADEFPKFAADCLREGTLLPEYAVNVNGDTFLCRDNVVLREGDSLLILTADAGG